MLSEKEIMDKLRAESWKCNSAFAKKDWYAVVFSYQTARCVSVFCNLSEKEMVELFGERPYMEDDRWNQREPAQGLFDERKVGYALERLGFLTALKDKMRKFLWFTRPELREEQKIRAVN